MKHADFAAAAARLKAQEQITDRFPYGGVELIDFGGVTQIGNAVKQFTEVYDRGYWGAGSRTADESYDLFSFAMLCIQLQKKPMTSADYANMLPQNRSLTYLIEEIRSSTELGRMSPFLEKALKGSYTGTAEAIKEWRRLGLEPTSSPMLQTTMPWLKISFGVALLLFVSTLCLYWR
jgi:serine/threonine-protein kinase